MKNFMILCCLLSGLLFAADKRVMTPEDLAELQSVSSAAMSPDGSMIAYTVSVPRELFKEDSGRPWTELYVWDAERGSRLFIGGKQNFGNIQWTPDGQGIGFTAKRDGDKQTALYVIPVDGGEARKVFEHDTAIGSYEWSTDGNTLVFLSTEAANKDKKKLADKGFNQEYYEEDPRWTKVWTVNLAAEGPKKAEQLDMEGQFSLAKLSPDGKSMAVIIAPTPLVDDSLMERKLHIIDVATGKKIMSADNPGKLGEVAWSPNSNAVAFKSAADRNDPNAGRMWIADKSTNKVTKFYQDALADVGTFAWQDGNTLLYTWEEGVAVKLRAINVTNGESKERYQHPSVIFRSISLSKDGKTAALVGSSVDHPNEIYLWNTDKPQEEAKRITNSNPWLDNIKKGVQEVITYKARDGLELHGILIRPVDEEKGKRYPLVNVIHGGPEAHERNDWKTRYSTFGHIGAGRGFAVFFPNYRASTGRGVAFSKLDHGKPAHEQFNDIVDGVKHLVDMGLVDEKRVGVTGGSYGGYATAWCATALSEHFAAGVMFVGISNKISKSGTSDIPEELFLVHDRKRLWDNWDLFLEASPIYHVKNAKTPLLIMHGKEDTRVHPAQSMELYRHLKTLDQAPVRLIFYPGEGHGNRKSASQYDYSLRTLRWMEHYLMGDGGEPPPLYLDYAANNEAEGED